MTYANPVSSIVLGENTYVILTNFIPPDNMNNENLTYNKIVYSPDFIPIYPATLKDGLSLQEGYVYGFIHFYTFNEKNKGRKFYFTNNQLSEILNFSSQQISRIINQLVKKNYIRSAIKIFKNRGKVRFIVALKK